MRTCILLLLAAAFLLAACGEAAEPTPNTGANAAATATPLAASTPTQLETIAVSAATATAQIDTPAADLEPTATGAAVSPTIAVASPTPELAPNTPVPPTETTAPEPTAQAPTPTTQAAPAAPGAMVAQTLIVPEALRQGVFAEERQLTLPEEFNISLFDAGLSSPRWIVTGPDGRLWVTERGAGRVLVYEPQGSAETPARPTVFLDGLTSPHGIAFHEGYVYIAETTRVLRVRDAGGTAAGEPEVIISGIPTGGHSTRTLLFTPGGKLLVSIGSSCNVCREADERRAAVMIYEPDGSNGRLYATGLRNAVGLALHPGTGEVWFTNNGRDRLGDDIPMEIMGTLHDGADYGWPDCYGDRVVDRDFGGDASRCERMRVAELQVQAHSAPLGNTFIPAQGWPSPYAGNMIVAYHGSWNRSVPTGYKLVRVPMENGQAAGEDVDFITGWLEANGSSWGRPVAVAVGSDGALYVTDDDAGAIYRVYQAPR